MLPIQIKLIRHNYTENANTPTYIVIHDTANYNRTAGAWMHYNYFNSENRSASAHFFVDDKTIIQTVKVKDMSWHCGDGGGIYGIRNSNSIGIEICVNQNSDYKTAVANTVDLVKYLMKEYNIKFERVVRHYDASRKMCLISFVWIGSNNNTS